MIYRSISQKVLESLTWSPVVGIIGPRQVGKTTLVKHIASQLEKSSIYLDLELTSDRRKLEDAESYLIGHEDKCVIIDEVQLMPELFALLRALIDRKREAGRFILLGSAAPHIVGQVTETLAGRITYYELFPFSRSEVYPSIDLKKHWLYGGFPEALLAKHEQISRKWLDDFIETFIQRDLPRLGYTLPTSTMRRLITMLAHVNGDLLNASNLGRSLGVSSPTVGKYLEILNGSFLIRQLPPFHVNLKKQLVKSPKVYLRDTGLLHHLLRIYDYEQLLGHPAVGNSWEVFVIEQIIRESPEFSDFFFYRTRSGAEIDLLILRPDGKRWGIEIKFSNAPKVGKGFYHSLEDIQADRGFIITPGSETYPQKGAEVGSLDWFLREVLKG